MPIVLAKIVLWISAIAFIGYGLVCLVSPDIPAGYAGLAWNKEKLPGGLKNVSDLWKPELRGKVEVLSEFRDTMGLIMLEQGVDIEKDFTADQFGAAIKAFNKFKELSPKTQESDVEELLKQANLKKAYLAALQNLKFL